MVKMSSGLLSLKWNHHRSTFLHVLANIRQKESYSDVTLACAGKFYPTHKLVLSTCSEYFEEMFERTQCKHPVIVLKDIGADDLEALLSYMYDGEVNVLQENLSSLIKAAECLKIKGLAVADNDPNDRTKEKKLHSSSSNSGTNISSNNNRDVQRNDRRPVNSNGSGIKRSNVNSGSGDDGAQLAKRRRPEVRSQLSTSTPPEEGEAAAPAEDVPSDAAGAADSGAEGGSSDKADSDVPPDVQGSTELPEDSQSFIQGLNAEAGVKAEPVEVLDELGFDDRDDAEDSGAGVGPASTDLPDFTEEKFSGGEGEDPALWSGGDAPDLFSQPSTSNFGEDESNNDHGGGGKSGNTSSSIQRVKLESSKANISSAEVPSSSRLSSFVDSSSNSHPGLAPSHSGSSIAYLTHEEAESALNWLPKIDKSEGQFGEQPVQHGHSLGLDSDSALSSIFDASSASQPPLSANHKPASRQLQELPPDGFRVAYVDVPPMDPSSGGAVSGATKGKTYLCNLCEYSTTLFGNLKTHFRQHTKEKPFACNLCDYRARQQSNLKTHMRKHTGEKPYACEFCPYKSSQHSNLKIHRMQHTGDRPFECPFCLKKFSRHGYFHSHYTLHPEHLQRPCPYC